MADELNIQDYLDATGDSAKRSRNITIAIVIACVLVFTGLLNSLQSNWMLSRFNASKYPNSEYIQGKIGSPPPGWESKRNDDPGMRYYDMRYREFVSALAKSYVDSAMLVRVPFFGIAVDVNDLGLVGGIGFIILLIWYRFSLSREIDNLRLSFSEAARLRQLEEFYKLLAMRQVFTIPNTDRLNPIPINRSFLLVWFPKLICWMPVVLHFSVMAYDIGGTPNIGEALSHARFAALVVSEVSIALVMIVLAVMATQRQRRIDHIWDEQWDLIARHSSTDRGDAPPPAPPPPENR